MSTYYVKRTKQVILPSTKACWKRHEQLAHRGFILLLKYRLWGVWNVILPPRVPRSYLVTLC